MHCTSSCYSFLKKKEFFRSLIGCCGFLFKKLMCILRNLALFGSIRVPSSIYIVCALVPAHRPTILSLHQPAMRRLLSRSFHSLIAAAALLVLAVTHSALAQTDGFDPNVNHYNGSSYQLVNGSVHAIREREKESIYLYFALRKRHSEWFHCRISQMV